MKREPSELYKRIIREVKRQMYEQELTIRAAAEKVGVTRQTMQSALDMKHEALGSTVLKLIVGFGIDIKEPEG